MALGTRTRPDKDRFGVCELIARHASMPLIRPVHILGAECHTGGAFLTVRWLLYRAGADAKQIRPSTPLAPFTRRYPQVFLEPISRLAPGRLPLVQVRMPQRTAALVVIVAAAILYLVGVYASLPVLELCAILALIFSWISTSVFTSPSTVSFGELQTFRDLALLIARGGTQTTTQ
jgi:hypothetical protein